jgi:hypothetical protein
LARIVPSNLVFHKKLRGLRTRDPFPPRFLCELGVFARLRSFTQSREERKEDKLECFFFCFAFLAALRDIFFCRSDEFVARADYVQWAPDQVIAG